MSSHNPAHYAPPARESPLQLHETQHNDHGGYPPSQPRSSFQMNLSQYADNGFPALPVPKWSSQAHAFSSNTPDSSGAFPAPPFPPVNFANSNEVASLLRSHSDYLKTHAIPTNASSSGVQKPGPLAPEAAGNDSVISDASSTSEMDLEDGEVSEEESGHAVPTLRDSDERVDPIHELRRQASIALKDLYAQEIDFACLLKEGINRKTLEDLSKDLEIRTQNLSEKPLALEEPKDQPPELVATEIPHLGLHPAQPQSVTPSALLYSSSLDLPVPEDFARQESSKGSFKNGGPQAAAIDVPHQNGDPGRLPPQPEGPSHGLKIAEPAATIVVDKSNSTTKIMDRKDYIARMLEAKKRNMPKSIPGSGPFIPKPDEISSLTSKVDAIDGASRAAIGKAPAIGGASLPTESHEAAAPGTGLSRNLNREGSFSSNLKALAELEAKKKAQTELARQKMEDLLNRSHLKANDGSKKIVAGQDSLQESQHRKDAPNPTLFDNSSQTSRSIMPSAIVSPSQATSFSIPGLFTISNSPATSVKASGDAATRYHDMAVHITDERPPSLPSTQIHQMEPSTSDATNSTSSKDLCPGERQANVSRAASSRKRQKAADFIESPPSKTKRHLGSGDDTSVIIEVSDDELYGDTHENLARCSQKQATPHVSSIDLNFPADNSSSLPPSPRVSALADAPPITPSRGLAASRGGFSNGSRGLKSTEKAIEEMQKRIVELEQRRKEKSRTSRAQTPATPPKGIRITSIQNTSLPDIPAPASIAERVYPTSILEPCDAQNTNLTTNLLTKNDLGPSNGDREKEEQPGAMRKLPETLKASISDQNRITTEFVTQSNDVFARAPEGQSQHEHEVGVGADTTTNIGINARIRSQSPIPPTKTLGDLSPKQNTSSNPPSDTDSLPSFALKNIAPGGEPELQITMLRLEQLRVEMALLEQKLQAGPKLNEALIQEREKSLAPQNISPASRSLAPLPEPITAWTADTVHDELAAHPHDVPEIAQGGNLKNQQASADILLSPAIDSSGQAPFVDNNNSSNNEYDPAEDAMDLSESPSEQGEIIEESYASHPVSNPEQSTNQQARNDSVHQNAQTEDTYEPPATFSIPGDTSDSASLTEYELQDRKSGDTPKVTATALRNSSVSLREETRLREPPPSNDTVKALAHLPSQSRSIGSSDDESLQESEYEPPAPESPMDLDALISDEKSKTKHTVSPVQDLGVAHAAPPGQAAETNGIDSDAPELVRPESKVPSFDLKLSGKEYTPYESPLKRFKDFRYHPEFLLEASQGFRSNTYSNSLDDKRSLCPYGTLGICNDQACSFQHLDKIKLSDDKILVQLGSAPANLIPEHQDRFRDGLRNLVGQMRIRNVRDFNQMATEIVAYRQEFVGDKSKVLAL